MGTPSFKHVRTATGLSQADFAKLIDLGLDSVRSVEQGKLSISERIARRVFVATGALPSHLVLTSSEEAQAWDRTSYTSQHFEAWQRITSGDLLAGINGGVGLSRFHSVLGAMLTAASIGGKLGRFQAALTLAAFDILFSEGIQMAARNIAHREQIGADFDLLATIAGRIEPKQKAAP